MTSPSYNVNIVAADWNAVNDQSAEYLATEWSHGGRFVMVPQISFYSITMKLHNRHSGHRQIDCLFNGFVMKKGH